MTTWPSRRALLGDLALAATVAVIAGAGTWRTSAWQLPPIRPADALGYALATGGAAALIVHRRWPLQVLAVATAAAAVSLAMRYPYGPPFLAMAIAMYVVATRLSWQRSLAVFLVAFTTVFAAIVAAAGGRLLSGLGIMLAGAMGWLAVPCAAGVVLRIRRDDVAQARGEEARRGAYEERLRIAREIHDVAGQRLAAINIQSAIALYVADRRPERTREMLKAIKEDSKNGLDDLRATLAMLSDRSARATPRRPMPGLGELDALMLTMNDSGLRVKVEVTGDRGDLAAAVDLAAYRIVQQSLADVLRHASSTTATVRIDYTDDGVRLEVSDDRFAGAEGESTAVAGMRERAAAVGGALTAGPRPGGGYHVVVHLPLRSRT
ncbi:MAG: sensor histidine kinase [Actinoallomurus sp.]